MINSLVNSAKVMISDVRMKIACLKSWSTIMRMVSKLEEIESFLMKSMDIKFHSHFRIGSCLRDP